MQVTGENYLNSAAKLFSCCQFTVSFFFLFFGLGGGSVTAIIVKMI